MTKKSNQKRLQHAKTICYVVAYKDTDYVRTNTISRALRDLDNVKLLTVFNSGTTWFRYFEVLWKLLWIRLTARPDAYMLGFRGYELLLPMRVLTIGKPLLFDEFIVLRDWLVEEHHKLRAGGLLDRMLVVWQRLLYAFVTVIVTDTPAHAERSSEVYGVPIGKYRSVYVGADESVFNRDLQVSRSDSSRLRVFYYGSGLPLHGFEAILEAAEVLSDRPVDFVLVGGKGHQLSEIQSRISQGSVGSLRHVPRVSLEKLAEMIAESDVCLGGPFGNTPQSSRVITGKTFQFLAMGKPVILGASPATNEAGFEDRRNCLIANQTTAAQSIVDQIEWLLARPERVAEIGQAGHQLYLRQFSPQAIAKQMAEVLKLI